MPAKFDGFIDRNTFNGCKPDGKNNDVSAWKIIITEFMRQNSDYAFLPKTIAHQLDFSNNINEVRKILDELVNEGYLKRAKHGQGYYYIWRVFPFNSQTNSFKEI